MRSSIIALLLTSVIGTSAAPSACSSTPSVSYAGVDLTTCNNYSYEGETVSEYPGVKNIQACAKLCATTANCNRAVYDKVGSYCLMKAADNNAVANPDKNYAIAEVVKQVDDGTIYNTCYPQLNAPKASNGARYLGPCANADFQADSVDIIGSVQSATDCADVCAKRSDCISAVWVQQYNACHIKPNTPNPLVYRRGFFRMTALNNGRS